MFEDALAGVEAGRAGDFGFVVGVDRVGQAEALREHGADVVVEDLAELLRLIRHGAYDVDPWEVRERTLDLDVLAQSESVFALSNGHIGLRGNLDEGEPYGLPGHLPQRVLRDDSAALRGGGLRLPGVRPDAWSTRPTARSSGCWSPTSRSTCATGASSRHERTLDLRAGTLTREVEWTSPTEDTVRLRTTRLVSFAQRAIAAIEYIVEPVDKPAAGRRPVGAGGQRAAAARRESARLPAARRRDAAGRPRVRAPRHARPARDPRPPDEVERAADGRGLRPRDRVRARPADGLPVRAGLRAHDLLGRDRARSAAAAGQVHRLRLVGAALDAGAPRPGLGGRWPRPSTPAGRTSSACSASTSTSSGSGPTSRSRASRACSRRCASGCSTSSSPGARNEGRAIPAKGLTGSGYDGHAFWDTETFVLPMLTYALPSAARDALRWRHATLDKAQHRAEQLGLEGAAFPWRTIAGEECSSYWPAGTAAFHINADIANAVSKLHQRDRRRRLHRGLRRRAARRDRAAVALARAPRQPRQLPHRRGHRPRRVQRGRRQQRLHEPRGAAEPARRRRRRRAPAGARPPPGRRRGGGGRVARRRQRDDDPLRRGARRPPAVRGLHRPRALGLRRHPRRRLPAVPALPLLRPLPQAGRQAGRPGARPGACSATASPPRRRRATSPTTSRSPCATRRCRPARRR